MSPVFFNMSDVYTLVLLFKLLPRTEPQSSMITRTRLVGTVSLTIQEFDFEERYTRYSSIQQYYILYRNLEIEYLGTQINNT